jgi:hypothetical protein
MHQDINSPGTSIKSSREAMSFSGSQAKESYLPPNSTFSANDFPSSEVIITIDKKVAKAKG